jgi:hypothetical protein
MRADFYDTIDKEYVNVPERRPKEKEEAALEYINDQAKK